MKIQQTAKLNIAIFLLCLIGIATSVGRGESIRFVVVGDTQGHLLHTNSIVLSEVVDQAMGVDPEIQFALFTGDLIRGDDGDDIPADFQAWREIVGAFYQADFYGAKVYVTPGNHDLNGESWLSDWQSAFYDMPDNGPDNAKKATYSFDVGPCHLVVVNTESPSNPHQVDLDWLEADLAATTRPIILVFGHDPAYPIAKHIGDSLDAEPEQRDAFWALLAEYDVRAYFCGHEHLYDRWIKDGVQQIIVGNGGGGGEAPIFLILDADEEENDVTISIHKVISDTISNSYKLSDTNGVADEDRSSTTRSDFWFLEYLPCTWMIVVPITMLLSGTKLRDESQNE
jgi:hypothetical protein